MVNRYDLLKTIVNEAMIDTTWGIKSDTDINELIEDFNRIYDIIWGELLAGFSIKMDIAIIYKGYITSFRGSMTHKIENGEILIRYYEFYDNSVSWSAAYYTDTISTSSYNCNSPIETLIDLQSSLTGDNLPHDPLNNIITTIVDG